MCLLCVWGCGCVEGYIVGVSEEVKVLWVSVSSGNCGVITPSAGYGTSWELTGTDLGFGASWIFQNEPYFARNNEDDGV